MTLSREQIENGYEALFDERTRAAHLATLLEAHRNESSRWPTVLTVRKFAALFDVPAAELGAFFGLLRQSNGKREVWVDVVRSPDTGWLVGDAMTNAQARAFGMMQMLAD
ncbi:MAG: hypothetical protein KUG65_05820 [Sphingomonadaceae bacterium]|nr:hypothetical protein [Sphingomonadaceae bacterium]